MEVVLSMYQVGQSVEVINDGEIPDGVKFNSSTTVLEVLSWNRTLSDDTHVYYVRVASTGDFDSTNSEIGIGQRFLITGKSLRPHRYNGETPPVFKLGAKVRVSGHQKPLEIVDEPLVQNNKKYYATVTEDGMYAVYSDDRFK